jgi:hypothetical protein
MIKKARPLSWELAFELGDGWAWEDLNLRLLPYQGSALTELSYRPEACGQIIAGHAEIHYRKVGPDRQSVSLSVTSIPPASIVTRL